MAIFKRGNTYWFEFKFNGVRIRESTKQKNRIEARKIEAGRKTQLAKREVGIKEKKKAPAFVDFQKRFLALPTCLPLQEVTVAIFKRGNTYWFEFKFNGVG